MRQNYCISVNFVPKIVSVFLILLLGACSTQKSFTTKYATLTKNFNTQDLREATQNESLKSRKLVRSYYSLKKNLVSYRDTNLVQVVGVTQRGSIILRYYIDQTGKIYEPLPNFKIKYIQ